MDDKKDAQQFAGIEQPGKLEEIYRIIHPIRAYYESKLPTETFQPFDFHLYCTIMLWRYCPEKLLYPALGKWVKALQNDIDPLEIFQLGWYTGVKFEELSSRVKASLNGRLHRMGIRTDDKINIDPRLRKVYDEYNSSDKKKTLNQLLQREFGIKNINKPNAELNRCRAKYYRASRKLRFKQYSENIPDDFDRLKSAYLEYYLRNSFFQDFSPSGEALVGFRRHGNGRTDYDAFIHETAYEQLSNEELLKYIQQKQKQKQIRRKRQKKIPSKLE